MKIASKQYYNMVKNKLQTGIPNLSYETFYSNFTDYV